MTFPATGKDRPLVLGVVRPHDQHQRLPRQIAQGRAMRVLVVAAEIPHDALEIDLKIEGSLVDRQVFVLRHDTMSKIS